MHLQQAGGGGTLFTGGDTIPSDTTTDRRHFCSELIDALACFSCGSDWFAPIYVLNFYLAGVKTQLLLQLIMHDKTLSRTRDQRLDLRVLWYTLLQ